MKRDRLDLIIEEVSLENNIPKDVVKLAFTSSFLFIRNTIESIPVNDIKSLEDFNKLRVSFNLPEIGKLYTTYNKIEKARRKFEFFKEKRNDKNKEDTTIIQ